MSPSHQLSSLTSRGCGHWGGGAVSPSHQLSSLGEHCKLPWRGLGLIPGTSWFWCIVGASKITNFCPQDTIKLSLLHMTVSRQVGLKSQEGGPMQSRWDEAPLTETRQSWHLLPYHMNLRRKHRHHRRTLLTRIYKDVQKFCKKLH